MGISFKDALNQTLAKTGQSLDAVAEGAGVPRAALHSFMQEDAAALGVKDAIKIAEFFGLSLDRFLEDPKVANHIAIAQLYSSLPPLLKAQLEAYAQERSDARYPPPPAND
ncbi:helix-turn-helix transcriptional regulator [uncultured Lentibacter sp.]|uniref:helix-turn-helix domain-containing protein n=1 Tax=uncultured Lentibacter sp. TaxID=1659309 RepID=UPI0026020D0B|nr:helix-turn-helix transcriptional regulator [uncultured Lentibacter sp.]